MFLAFSGFHNFKVYKMNFKYSFLNGGIEEEVYIELLQGFILGTDKNIIFKLKKALYGL